MLRRRIRYPDPAIKVNDTVKIDLSTGKIADFIRFDTGVIAMVTGGRNMGRVGVITHRERHDGGFNIVHIKDAIDNSFATREANVFVIGREKPWISLPKGKGVKVGTILLSTPHQPEVLTLYSSPLQRREIAVVRMRLRGNRWILKMSGLFGDGSDRCHVLPKRRAQRRLSAFTVKPSYQTFNCPLFLCPLHPASTPSQFDPPRMRPLGITFGLRTASL